jgi:diphthine synthase
VVVIAAGHPLVATTHYALLAEASRRGIDYRLIHGVSGVVAAMTESGLDFYKYGRVATVPGPWRMVLPYSTLTFIYGNLCIGLHSLLLLDTNDKGSQLKPSEAATTLLNADSRASREVESYVPAISDLEVIVIARAGIDVRPEVRYYSTMKELAGSVHEHGVPSSLIIPGEVNSVEREHVESLHGFRLRGLRHELRPKLCKNFL